MIPFISVSHLEIPTAALLFALALAVCFVTVSAPLSSRIGWKKSAALVILTAIAAIAGGRLLHVAWERPRYFLENLQENPQQILKLDGLVFYGAFGAALLAFNAMTRSFLNTKTERRLAWDLSAIAGALCIGILRLACFADGCCWGKPSSVLWAVRFHDQRSVMPWLGIPVHPVQLYESALGFALAGGLAYLFRHKRMEGQLLHLLFVGYGVGRFMLEAYRGDSFRGIDLLLGMSTSQILSIVFIVYAATRFAFPPEPRLSGVQS
jgi:phosphatidylglycerol---prolipoprotein diacylglyceryl transferase